MQQPTKKIGIVTGTRAEYGLMSRVIHLMQLDVRFSTVIFVTGTHLSPDYGHTIDELEEQEVDNIYPIEILLSSASRVGVAKSVGLATLSFADAFSKEKPDAILILGDRFEILAAAQTAMLLGIPIIHLHGGEITEGAFDDAIRHAVTKLANLHFVSTELFARRVEQMGENSNSIFVVGSFGIDNILNTPRMDVSELENSLGSVLDRPIALVTYHTVTNTLDTNENDIQPLVEAIVNNPQLLYVITYPNADGYGKRIISQWEVISSLHNVILLPSLGFRRYLSLMEHVDCVIGNSSSGIIEAPTFKVGTVNIGTRQKGRPTADSIINVEMSEKLISGAIKECCSDKFKRNLVNIKNPYGEGGAAKNMIEILFNIDFNSYKIKTFVDVL
ncbi:MAG: hypothetical protein OFPII_18980 [Osedax symbiont Rs1]|nr:MAG: hypothetical protein OFPII_18980 [Osedax symbiont Rs1]